MASFRGHFFLLSPFIKHTCMKKIFTLIALLVCIHTMWAQTISYTTAGSSYSQNFDGLIVTGATVTAATSGPFEILPANFAGSNVPGWYIERYAGSGTNVALAVGDGAANTGQHYSFGTTAATDRALGALASGTRVGRMGIILTNNTGATLNTATISFVTEMWRKGNGTVAHVYPFAYKLNATGINDATGFVTETNLNMVSPNVTTPNDQARDGNLAANRVAVTYSITGISWAAGQTLALRWDDLNEAGNDDALAIDDFTFSAAASASPTLNVSPSSLVIANTVVGTASAASTYSLTGSNLSGTAITVTAPANFEVATDGVNYAASVPVTYTAPNLSATISVRLSSTAAAGNYTAQVVANAGGGATAVNVTVSGKVLQTEPTTQASNVIISSIGNNSFTVNWTNGNGSSRLVVVRTTGTTAVAPADGTDYTVGQFTGTGNRVAYAGTGSGPIVVGSLTGATAYDVQVYEYNGATGANNYYTGVGAGNPASATTTGLSPDLVQLNFTSIATPQYGASGGSTRLPVMFFATVSGLTPNTTYRYFNQAATTTDFGSTNMGAGNPLLIDHTVSPMTFTYSSAPAVTSAGNFGLFETDATGSFSGAFGYANTGNARFGVDSVLYPTIAVAEDVAPYTLLNRFALNVGIEILAFGNTPAAADSGTFIKGISSALPGNIVGLWSTVDGNLVAQRPLAMTIVEDITTTGAPWPASFVPAYSEAAGAWNTIIPNANANGVRLIQQFDLATGNVIGCNSDADGIWPTGTVNTVNPGAGTTGLQINAPDAPLNAGSCFSILPVRISNFAAQKVGTTAKISWTTVQEINSREFVIERSTDQRTWTVVSTVAAAGTSTGVVNYSTTDFAPAKGINFYRLRMVDINNRTENSATKSVLFGNADVVLITPNPASTFATIYMGKNSNTLSQIFVSDMNGKLVERFNTADQTHTLQTARYSKGLYMIKVITEGNTSTHKLVIQ
ncbi:MAG: T9SS type A sorting domain-containing protein [Sphingobacteriales bacterium]|nr:MAG: T9SS type A sorting domain-containing protein [Sphingobacteriales bacterium]